QRQPGARLSDPRADDLEERRDADAPGDEHHRTIRRRCLAREYTVRTADEQAIVHFERMQPPAERADGLRGDRKLTGAGLEVRNGERMRLAEGPGLDVDELPGPRIDGAAAWREHDAPRAACHLFDPDDTEAALSDTGGMERPSDDQRDAAETDGSPERP